MKCVRNFVMGAVSSAKYILYFTALPKKSAKYINQLTSIGLFGAVDAFGDRNK